MLEYRLAEFARELGVCIHRTAEKGSSRKLSGRFFRGVVR
jgi:hypothetical protein